MVIHKIMEPPKITPPRQKPPLPPLAEAPAAAKKLPKPPLPTAEKPEKTEKPLVWDCGSSLYDSFELKSFEKQLDSAIHSRSLSMPHLTARRLDFLDSKPPLPPSPQTAAKKQSKIFRSISRFLRSVLKPRNNTAFSPEKDPAGRDGFYVVYDYEKSGVLTTIPEAPESDHSSSTLSPETKAFVRRTASDRFMFAPIGISCIQ